MTVVNEHSLVHASRLLAWTEKTASGGGNDPTELLSKQVDNVIAQFGAETVKQNLDKFPKYKDLLKVKLGIQ